MPALELNALEARVLGVLVEKERTTPEGYPLSLNALVAGCNQKNNRDPVLNVGEREVNAAILNLRVAGLVEFVQLVGQRVEKYRHKAGAGLHLEPAEVAVLAELLLRGSQQPGELRGRAARMHPLPTLEELQAVLDALAAKGFVARLERRAGERTARWAQLLAPEAGLTRAEGPDVAATRPASVPAAAAPAARPSAAPPAPGGLEARVARLEAEVAALRAHLGRSEPS
jgi:uncharacterized protein YceH (UPF0502 family)